LRAAAVSGSEGELPFSFHEDDFVLAIVFTGSDFDLCGDPTIGTAIDSLERRAAAHVFGIAIDLFVAVTFSFALAFTFSLTFTLALALAFTFPLTFAFAPQRQYKPKKTPSPPIPLLIPTNPTPTPKIPLSSTVLKSYYFKCSSRIKPGTFTSN